MVKQPGFVDPNQRKLLEKCNSLYLYFFEFRASSDNFTANFAKNDIISIKSIEITPKMQF